jgi:hypothetical protein
MKNAPRWKLRVMAAASSSVRLRGRFAGLKVDVDAPADVGVVAGGAEGAAEAGKVL